MEQSDWIHLKEEYQEAVEKLENRIVVLAESSLDPLGDMETLLLYFEVKMLHLEVYPDTKLESMERIVARCLGEPEPVEEPEGFWEGYQWPDAGDKENRCTNSEEPHLTQGDQ